MARPAGMKVLTVWPTILEASVVNSVPGRGRNGCKQFAMAYSYLGRHDIRSRDDVANWQLTQGDHRVNVIGWQDLHSDNADSAASGACK